tara:strand:- start:30334 stop:30990 length:657 start_codon:yes stop_codon:yes gene_type:complete
MNDTNLPRAVVFDWDNTLVDSWPPIQDALNTTFRAYGLPEWSMEETRAKVRHSMRDSFPQLFGDAWEQAGDVFYARYAEIHAEAVKPAEGAADLLTYLAGQGVYLGVVSNKKGDYLRAEAEQLDWAKHFGRIVGAFDAERDKPDPAPVDMALAPGGIARGPDVWFVGDADIDLTCGINAGCVPVLVRPEAPSVGEFPLHPPTHHFVSCAQLCNFLQTM